MAVKVFTSADIGVPNINSITVNNHSRIWAILDYALCDSPDAAGWEKIYSTDLRRIYFNGSFYFQLSFTDSIRMGMSFSTTLHETGDAISGTILGAGDALDLGGIHQTNYKAWTILCDDKTFILHTRGGTAGSVPSNSGSGNDYSMNLYVGMYYSTFDSLQEDFCVLGVTASQSPWTNPWSSSMLYSQVSIAYLPNTSIFCGVRRGGVLIPNHKSTSQNVVNPTGNTLLTFTQYPIVFLRTQLVINAGPEFYPPTVGQSNISNSTIIGHLRGVVIDAAYHSFNPYTLYDYLGLDRNSFMACTQPIPSIEHKTFLCSRGIDDMNFYFSSDPKHWIDPMGAHNNGFGSISGTVTLNQIPIQEIEIDVYNVTTKEYVKSVLTNELGEYTIPNLSNRYTYDIIARGLPYGKNDKIRSNVTPV